MASQSCFPRNHQGVTKPFSSPGVAPSVEAFDKLVISMVAEFLKNSRVLAGDVETHVSTSLSLRQPQWHHGVSSVFPFTYAVISVSALQVSTESGITWVLS